MARLIVLFISCLFMLLQPVWAVKKTTSSALTPVDADLYEEYRNQNGNEKVTAEQALNRNLRAINKMNRYKIKPSANKARVNSISKKQADLVYKMLVNDPVTNFAASPKYDPDGVRGFCFGRAMWVHIQLLRMGVNQDAIKKIFIVGPAKAGNIYWQFHVATLVKATSGGWYAIDTIPHKVLKLNDWYNNMKQFDAGNRQIFFTEPEKFGPDADKYRKGQGALSDPFYHQYFDDQLKNFREHPDRLAGSFKKIQCQYLFN